MVLIKGLLGTYNDRDDMLLDQRRDVIVVFWACMLPIQKWIPRIFFVVFASTSTPVLTLIRMAGGVYDSRNLDQVKLHKAWSNKKF